LKNKLSEPATVIVPVDDSCFESSQMGKHEMHTEFWWGNLLKAQKGSGKIILNQNLGKYKPRKHVR
jgi:hypothetical protein